MIEVDYKGQISRIVFVNPSNGYTVAQLVRDDSQQAETVVGVMPSVVEGDLVRVRGNLVRDKRFGMQIRADLVEPIIPTTTVGIERYLASGAITGVGKILARRMVDFFGDSLSEALNNPERLMEMPGIGEIRSATIISSWQERVTTRKMLISLYGMGIGNALAARLIVEYGNGAYKIVKDNPYRLAREIRGVGFLTADRLARSAGVPINSPARIEGGLHYYLDAQSSDGHCFIPVERLVQECAGFLEVDIVEVEAVLRQVLEDGGLRKEDSFDEDGVYLPRLYNAEVDCARGIARLLRLPVRHSDKRLRKALTRGVDVLPFDLTGEQVDAVWDALSHTCAIITGGPGTGKTTVIRALISGLRHLDEEVLLCAPTGRAAKRMTETTGMEARTIHRLLEFNPSNRQFGRDDNNPLSCTAVIVDEVSMIDIELMASLLRALAPNTRLVLVGDKDQLESVGPGAVLRDFIASEKVPLARLTVIHRQAEQSLIVVNAHRILQGLEPLSKAPYGRKVDYFFLPREDGEECAETIRTLIAERIPKRFGLDPVRDVQVLTPMYKGSLGAQQLNQTLQERLNPTGASITKGDRIFRVGDRVMQIRNNYDKEVFNGDVGFVTGVVSGTLQIQLGDGRTVPYSELELEELTLAYAVTIHKSQGSEYPAVVIALHPQHYVMLRRNLLYTALTRGKRLVVIAGTRKALAQAVRNDQTRRRYTRLSLRLRHLATYGE
jgi:exodeoxyribonuclease V alpha subunit